MSLENKSEQNSILYIPRCKMLSLLCKSNYRKSFKSHVNQLPPSSISHETIQQRILHLSGTLRCQPTVKKTKRNPFLKINWLIFIVNEVKFHLFRSVKRKGLQSEYHGGVLKLNWILNVGNRPDTLRIYEVISVTENVTRISRIMGKFAAT